MDCGTAKVSRPIESMEESFEKALSHINDSIGNLKRAFSPVMENDVPKPISNSTNPVACKPPSASRIDGMVDHVCGKIHDIAEEINGICAKSRV